MSAGGRFWNCNFTGMHPNATHDRRNAFINIEAYQFVKLHEKLLAGQAPVANVGIYYSRPTRLFYKNGSVEGDSFSASIKGLERVLLENHIQYDFIADDQVSHDRLEKYALVLLPNVRCMSHEEVEIFRSYVHKGGNLLATYATSLYDENGKELENFSMADLFGCNYTGSKINSRKDSYQYILNPQHSLVNEVSHKTELLINAAYTLLTKAKPETEVICTLVPTVHNQPPEKAWVEGWSKENPTVVQSNFGKGKVIYFANQPDKVAYEIGHQDVKMLLKNAIEVLLGDKLYITCNAPESVHIGLTKSQDRPSDYILSFVNTTSASGRPISRLVPVTDIEAKLRLPGTFQKFKVLKSQGSCKVKMKGNDLLLTLEKLEDFCAVHIRMEV